MRFLGMVSSKNSPSTLKDICAAFIIGLSTIALDKNSWLPLHWTDCLWSRETRLATRAVVGVPFVRPGLAMNLPANQVLPLLPPRNGSRELVTPSLTELQQICGHLYSPVPTASTAGIVEFQDSSTHSTANPPRHSAPPCSLSATVWLTFVPLLRTVAGCVSCPAETELQLSA